MTSVPKRRRFAGSASMFTMTWSTPAASPLPQSVDLPPGRPRVARDLLASKVFRIERGHLELVERSPDPVELGAQAITMDVDL